MAWDMLGALCDLAFAQPQSMHFAVSTQAGDAYVEVVVDAQEMLFVKGSATTPSSPQERACFRDISGGCNRPRAVFIQWWAL